MTRNLLLLTAATAAALLLIAATAGSPASANETEPGLHSPDGGGHQPLANYAQDGEDPASPAEDSNSDTRHDVQVWTAAAAAFAASGGLLLFLLRALTGRVAPPSPQEDGQH